MPKPLRNRRIGIYRCGIVNGMVSKGRRLRGDYVGVFNWDDLISRIIPDLRDNTRVGISDYPVPIASWQLRGTDPSKGVLGISRKSSPQPRREKIPETERWEAVVYDTGRALRVEGRKVVGPHDHATH